MNLVQEPFFGPFYMCYCNQYAKFTLWSPIQMLPPIVLYAEDVILFGSSIKFLAVGLINIRSHHAGHLVNM